MPRTTPRRIHVLRHSSADHPAYDTALSRAILLDVAAGRETETLRIFRPSRIVAFGRQDATAPGYAAAVGSARRQGYEAIERLAGGRAAAFHDRTIAFAWAIPHPEPRVGIVERFATLAGIMAAAFVRLGIDARIGEVPGEYCPGAYSVNANGTHKVMGVGQRLVKGAAHVGGVVVVDDHEAVIEVLEPVYAALDFEWDPAVTGSLAIGAPGIGWDEATDAILTEFGHRFELAEGRVSAHAEQAARRLMTDHLAPG
jgi:lipoate-protein ligase A